MVPGFPFLEGDPLVGITAKAQMDKVLPLERLADLDLGRLRERDQGVWSPERGEGMSLQFYS